MRTEKRSVKFNNLEMIIQKNKIRHVINKRQDLIVPIKSCLFAYVNKKIVHCLALGIKALQRK